MLCMKHRNMVSSLGNPNLNSSTSFGQAALTFCLLYLMIILVRGCLAWTLAFGQVSFKSYLAAQ